VKLTSFTISYIVSRYLKFYISSFNEIEKGVYAGMNKAVILGSNYFIGLSIIRCLGKNGVHTVAIDYSNKSCYGSKSKYLNEHLIAPHYKLEEAQYLEFIIEYAKKQNSKPILFPSADPYVEFIDKHLDILKDYYLINMTQMGFWTDVMDKGKLNELAKIHGVLVPETIGTDSPNFIENVEHEIGFPCIVKPVDSPSFMSIFRTKMFYCRNIEDVKVNVDKAHAAKQEVIIQRVIPGFDDHMYTFDAYLNQDSKVTHWITCQKQRQYPINFGASVYTEQRYVQKLYEIGAPFLESIGYKGFGEIEFKYDEDKNQFYLIEINARTTTLNSMFERVGINFPYISYKELTGSDIGQFETIRDLNIAWRYLFEDILASCDYLKKKQLKINDLFNSIKTKKVGAIWDSHDPLPGIYFILIILKKISRRILPEFNFM